MSWTRVPTSSHALRQIFVSRSMRHTSATIESMESTDVASKQNTDKRNKVSIFLIIFVVVALLISNSWFIFQNTQLNTQLTTTSAYPERVGEADAEISEEEMVQQKQMSYFVDDILPQYNNLLNIPTDSISYVKAYPLKGLENQSTGWIVETTDNNRQSYYLVSELLQTKLDAVMVPYAGQVAPCTLSKVITTGNEPGLGRQLIHESGYIVIAGENCLGYGGGNSIAVYTLDTGEKINLTGDFTVAGTTWKGTTSSGTATGKLIGVYGINSPQLVVSYGDDSWDGTVEEVRQIAFFDLQTGKLTGVQNFK